VVARAALGFKYYHYSLRKARRSENKTREDSPQSKFQNLSSAITLFLDKLTAAVKALAEAATVARARRLNFMVSL
jgi:hypothetical protein